MIVVRNFILRVRDFILPEQLPHIDKPPYSTVTDFARFLG